MQQNPTFLENYEINVGFSETTRLQQMNQDK